MHPGQRPAEAFRESVRPVSVFSSGFTTPFILLPLTAPSLCLLHSWTPKATEQGQSLMSVLLEDLLSTLVLLILDLRERWRDRNGLIFLHSKQLWRLGRGGWGRLQHLRQACGRPACPAAGSHVGGPSWPKCCLVRLQHRAELSDVPRPATTRCLCLGRREVTLAFWCFPTLSSEECRLRRGHHHGATALCPRSGSKPLPALPFWPSLCPLANSPRAGSTFSSEPLMGSGERWPPP